MSGGVSAETAAANASAYFGPCRHTTRVDVDSIVTGEVLAQLCVGCGYQLPADWRRST